MFVVYQKDRGYVSQVNFENIITTFDLNSVMYFEEQKDAENFKIFLKEYDEFENYEVREVKIM